MNMFLDGNGAKAERPPWKTIAEQRGERGRKYLEETARSARGYDSVTPDS